jgi:hypothetical protein
MLPFHPVANLFPLMDGEEYEAFKANIADIGQSDTVWTYQGKIIDGRNRARACEELGLKLLTREWDGKGSLVQFVVALNLQRRHLDKHQRAAVAVELLPHLEAEAKERQRQGGRRKVPQNVAEANGEAREQAAQEFNTNRLYVSAAKKLKEQAPDLFEQVKRGELKVTQASLRLKQRQKLAEMQAPQPVVVGGEVELKLRGSWSNHHFKELAAEVRSRPAFARRQEEIQRLQVEGERLRQQAEDAFRKSDDLRRQLDKDVRSAVENEHGPLVPVAYTWVRVNEVARERLESSEDPEERREYLLQLTGRCLDCETKLQANDPRPYCSWCDKHRGETHCFDCGAPLSDEEEGVCRRCWGVE